MPGIEKPNLLQPYLGGMVTCPACHGAAVISPPDYDRAYLCRTCRGTGLVEPPDAMRLYRVPDTSGDA